MINHEHRCIFIHIPKTAGTSVERAFGVRQGQPGGGHRLPAAYGEHWREYFTFCIVRNPWDRIVSAFFSELKKVPEGFKVLLPGCNGKLFEYRADFHGFVMELLPQLSKLNIAFKPQTCWLHGAEYDRILRFESLDAGWADLPTDVKPKGVLPQHNVSRHRAYEEYYSADIVSVVSHIYREEIEQFRFEAPEL